MKKVIVILFVVAFVIIGLCGCSKYTSHYFAVGFVHSNDQDSASMSFFEFEGSYRATRR